MKITILISAILIITSCDTSAQEKYYFEKLNFCTKKYNETDAVWHNNTIVFSADFKTKFYLYAVTDTNNSWTNPVHFFKNYDENLNYFSPAFKNIEQIYFTVSDDKPLKILSGVNDLDKASIKYKTYKNNNWSKNERNFIYNGIKCFVGHPAFDYDNNRIYFSAYFNDTRGGADIYSCGWLNGDWAEPINIGKPVNTDKDELYPFFDGEYLYFASNGHDSSDDFNIYKTKFENGEWMIPEKLDYPVNTEYNDFAPFVTENGSSILFTSDRDGTMDIFLYQEDIEFPAECVENTLPGRCVHVLEEGIAIDDTNWVLTWNMGDGRIIKGNDFDYCYENDGKYVISLNAYDKITGEQIQNAAQYNLEIFSGEYFYFTAPDTIKLNESFSSVTIENTMKKFSNGFYIWNIENKFIFNDSIDYKFDTPGTYKISLAVFNDKYKINSSENQCVYKHITVTE
ncbi:MAG: hypothetical protein Kow0068_22700 [Marinilabiliales bacterium]